MLPQPRDWLPECAQSMNITRQCVVLIVASEARLEPLLRGSQRLVHALPQLLLEGLEHGPQLLRRSLPPDDKALAVSGYPADMRERQKVERLRLAFATLPPVRQGEPAEFDQSRFLRVHFQPELRQSRS